MSDETTTKPGDAPRYTPDAVESAQPVADQPPRQADTTIREAQAQVDATILALGGYWPPLANLARLFEECGELARVVNQTYGPKPRKPDETAVAIHEELGDILYVTLALANDLGVDAASALADAIGKAHQRATPMGRASHERE